MTDEQLMTLAEEYQTPMHIFDMDVLKKRVAFLKNHLPARVSLCYAVKANTFIIKELCGQVERFEVCSPGELAICRRLHVPMEQVVYQVFIRLLLLWRCFSERACRLVFLRQSPWNSICFCQNSQKNTA